MNKFLSPVLLVVVSLTTGCASIVDGKHQSLSVKTQNKTQEVSDAKCELSNDKGTWYVTTPGSATVHRSYGDLAIRCEKAGSAPGIASVKSSTKSMAFGNILFGGVIGAGVDMASGAAYDYPSLIAVKMGETNQIAAPAPVEATPQSQSEKK